MKKKLFRVVIGSSLLSATLAPAAWAQTLPERLPEAPRPSGADDTTQVVDLQLLPDSLVEAPVPLDSAKLVWMQTPPELRDLVGDRINCFETDAPHAFNPAVMPFVLYFTERNRKYMQRVLERENLYFPLFEKYLAKYNLPVDLKYLAVVESALIPTAKSHVGATGLWQFMGPTAGDLRLRRDEWVDERMNPEKATEAACKHLRYLYGVFHDWELVLAAYNWGAGSMQRAMRRTGKKTFWDLYPHLPKETRNYVPTFTAIMYSMKYAQAHNLHSPELNYRYAEVMDTLQVGGRALDLHRLSQACGFADSSALLRYNPELKRSWLPEGYRSYAVQVPATARPQLAMVDRSTLFDYCRPRTDIPSPLAPLMARLQGVEAFPARTMAANGTPREEDATPAPRFRRLRHTVRRGETAAAVAGRYDVSTAQLARWNALRQGRPLVPGKQLVVFVPVAVPAAAPAVAAARKPTTPARLPSFPVKTASATSPSPQPDKHAVPTAIEEVVAAAEPVRSAILSRNPRAISEEAAATAATAATLTAPDDSLPGFYVVRRGDNLAKIAEKRGLTATQLMDWNELGSEKVVPGQKLVLRAPADEEAPVAEAPARKARTPEKASVAVAARPAPAPAVADHKVHMVQKGDTLYNISRRYQGVTVEQLRRLNNLTSDEVKPGQKLIVAR
ncbi:LysM peptidoglycan-binding domain-containing protein [Microvirga sp. STR05]|uniref:LysM peptidoglycan-binding domain-containing protein n=1 Tax=Hymenobacter duratus TaxID=2771356 RepID=A0ABR8JH92_9BACT|nr:LysM peptidoglycan-binding domain-containing protein [Hymenobacter duratus]MBD2713919.1 LysM peptidoglycan-binding domain-containing protein [Hymenobacter duratus]MBR7948821.1 LysM peptidoglycan-binding domain-containing protein [Microvirga sp. STR05]